MRKDMGRCIIEAPRRGSRSACSAKARDYGKIVQDETGYDYDGFTRLPATRKQEGFFKKLGSKSFSDVLGPLRNYFETACGRIWDDVYSEIANVLGREGSWGIRHILKDHIEVETCVVRHADGSLWVHNKRGVARLGHYYMTGFYVEPETGILRKTPHRPRNWWKPKPEPITVVPIDESSEYRRVNGIWFYQRWAKVESAIPRPVEGGNWRNRTVTYEYVTTLELMEKRQLNKKELKRLLHK